MVSCQMTGPFTSCRTSPPLTLIEPTSSAGSSDGSDLHAGRCVDGDGGPRLLLWRYCLQHRDRHPRRGRTRLLAKRELEHEAALQGFEGQRKALGGENKAKVVEADGAVEDSTDYIQMNGLTWRRHQTTGCIGSPRLSTQTVSAMTLSLWC